MLSDKAAELKVERISFHPGRPCYQVLPAKCQQNKLKVSVNDLYMIERRFSLTLWDGPLKVGAQQWCRRAI